jgi:hypothetical protein
VREEATRKQYEQIVWVTLGQEPNIVKQQELLHLELVGKPFEGEPTAEEKIVLLKQVMAGK